MEQSAINRRRNINEAIVGALENNLSSTKNFRRDKEDAYMISNCQRSRDGIVLYSHGLRRFEHLGVMLRVHA